MMRLAAIALALLWGSGCATQPDAGSRTAGPQNEQSMESPWEGEVLRVANRPSAPALDVGVVLFDPGVDAKDDSPTAAVRRLESKLLAGQLRDALVASNQWGVVRMVPVTSTLMPVNIRSQIIKSDGRDLVLQVNAIDAAGTVVFDHLIGHRETVEGEGFAVLFNAISNRLLQWWQPQEARDRASLLSLAEVRYAQQLSPDAFLGLAEESDGKWELRRLPADNDPMMRRVDRIRNQEYLFCDTVDEQYVALWERAGGTYALWRDAGREQAYWLDAYEARVRARGDRSDDSRYARMQAEYAAYRSYRMQEQAWFELAKALDGETQPSVIETADRVVTLEGTLDVQYETWRRLLRDIFAAEQGLEK